MNIVELNTLYMVRGYLQYCQVTAGATDTDTCKEVLKERLSDMEDNAGRALGLIDKFIADHRWLDR